MSDWWSRNKHRYPANWTDIATRLKDATGWTCEVCAAPHGPPPHILTVHHLSHVPADCSPENLLVCCQRCHLQLGPHIYTREQAICKLRERHRNEQAQLTMQFETPE